MTAVSLFIRTLLHNHPMNNTTTKYTVVVCTQVHAPHVHYAYLWQWPVKWTRCWDLRNEETVWSCGITIMTIVMLWLAWFVHLVHDYMLTNSIGVCIQDSWKLLFIFCYQSQTPSHCLLMYNSCASLHSILKHLSHVYNCWLLPGPMKNNIEGVSLPPQQFSPSIFYVIANSKDILWCF